MVFILRSTTVLLLLVAVNMNGETLGFSLTMSSTSLDKGSAAKPLEKKKVAVFGTGGYLGGCAYGFLQRAGSLYGTGIDGVGAPRAIVATSFGSANLNSVLSKNFVLAQADESYIRLTDMTSSESIQSKLRGFDAAVLATRYSFKTLPITMGSYGKGPNDKTREFFMDQPRSATTKLMQDPEYSDQVFLDTLEACKNSKKLKKLIVVETDAEFDAEESFVGDKYIQALEESEIPYTYIRPIGRMENIENFTFKKGVQTNLNIGRANSVEELWPVENKPIYREHIAAVCVQSLMTLGWEENQVIQVDQSPDVLDVDVKKVNTGKEWCVNSSIIQNSLAALS
ncbi:unnamed protein product [Pseudo-nitzschia multistriata]|uniref:NAD(P)-binding domain-containing protein n=1 Tax=Pseudo-nitzschia multistriata TaxID=183589 RepID=A0A448ZSW5_9STRA|nr:unnamed protein product [Pseudo-nitzschia multistriata]